MSRGSTKKDEILEVAKSHFAKGGYDRTVLEDIAKNCSITKPAIYYHFEDKESLFREVFCRDFMTLKALILNGAVDEDPVEALREYISIFGEFFLKNREFSSIFAREISKENSLMPKDCLELLLQIVKRLSEILDLGFEKGVFGRENPFMIQLMIVSTLSTYHTTKTMRKYINQKLKIREKLGHNPTLENLIPELTEKIIKAVRC